MNNEPLTMNNEPLTMNNEPLTLNLEPFIASLSIVFTQQFLLPIVLSEALQRGLRTQSMRW